MRTNRGHLAIALEDFPINLVFSSCSVFSDIYGIPSRLMRISHLFLQETMPLRKLSVCATKSLLSVLLLKERLTTNLSEVTAKQMIANKTADFGYFWFSCNAFLDSTISNKRII